MKKHQFEAILFDLDGTLVDSSRDIVESMNLTLQHFDYGHIEYQNCIGFIGDGIRMLVKRAFAQVLFDNPDTDIDPELLKIADLEYQKNYAVHLLDTTRPYSHVPETLARLPDFPMAVISNKSFIYESTLKRSDYI